MRGARTVWLYVAREVAIYTLVGLLAITFVFIGANMVRRLGHFLVAGVSLSQVLLIVRSVMVVSLAYTVPISFLLGVLVGVARLAADAEITALRACGLGLRSVVMPVLALGIGVSLLTAYISLEVEYRAKRAIRDTVLEMAASGGMIEPRVFKQVGDRMFYVDSRDRENRLQGIFIADQSDPERPLLIFAESGRFSFDPEQERAHLSLRDGDLHLEGEDPENDYNRISFEEFEYSFPVPLPRDGSRMRPRDMPMEQLREIVERARAGEPIGRLYEPRPRAYAAQIQRRYAVPLAPVLFALVAVPLALRPVRGARAFGALVGALLIALYYGLLTFFEYVAVEGFLPSAVALWCPNAVFAGLAAVLLSRAGRPD